MTASFWMREVYERIISQQTNGKVKGKDKKGQWGSPIRQPLLDKKGKGDDGDKGDRGKGTSNSGTSDWPSHWAFKNPKGHPFCRDYFLKTNCQGNCPVVNSSGWVCNAAPKDHSPDKCPVGLKGTDCPWTVASMLTFLAFLLTLWPLTLGDRHNIRT